MKSAALIILDGWGHREEPSGNAVLAADPKNYFALKEKYAFSTLEASGEAVGLPDGQMGNSEVGHLNIGAGRVVYQPLVRIEREMNSGEFYEIPLVAQAFERAVEKKRIHFLGLLSDGGVHSHLRHLFSLLNKTKELGIPEVYVHAFLDGRDTDPQSGIGFVEETEQLLENNGNGSLASISGRYYAMDRDNRWERVKKAYDVLVGKQAPEEKTAQEFLRASYESGVSDEFVLPGLIDPQGVIRPGDVVFFYNFRPDRAREMTRALTQRSFSEFEHEKLLLDYYCMSEYDATFEDVHVIYPNEAIDNTLGSVLSEAGLRQFRTAETEKYPHITFFFNGGRETPFDGEQRVLVHSPKVATYDLQPSMSAQGVKDALLAAVEEGGYSFYLVNFANPDMVGHTGVFEAAVEAIKTVDECLGEITTLLEEKDIPFIITADHGNAEQMYGSHSEVLTMHSTNPVPLIVSLPKKTPLREDGILSDLAPTILKLIGREIPKEFTGTPLY